MARFTYTVQDSSGTVTTGSVNADDEDAAVQSLQSKGFFILSIQAEEEKGKGIVIGGKKGAYGKVPGSDMVFFGEQLSTLVAGGIPLVRALGLLSEHAENKNMQICLGMVYKEVSAGGTLHKALEKHPKVFNEIWCSLVQAGEVSGQLATVLRQITEYVRSQEELKGKIISALAYPSVMALGAGGVLIYFMMFIVPTFAKIFDDFHMELPTITKVVMVFSNILTHYALVTLLVLAGIIWALKAYISTPAGLLNWNKFIFSLPLAGPLMKNMNLEQMLTTMSTLLRSGVSILNAVAVLENMFKRNLVFQNALKAAKADIAGGRSISESFKKTGIFPGMVTQMMWMGEESGKLPDIIVVLSSFYKQQINQFIARFTAMIDPILLVGMGGIVGVLVMSIFIPIFKMSSMEGGSM